MIDLENEVIPTVCPLWREVGRQLHLKTSLLDEIDADCCVYGVRRCCSRMFEEWLKQDSEASWYAVWSACKKVKENLSSGPYTPHTKESIESLKQLISTLPATLCIEDVPQSLPSPVPKSRIQLPSQHIPHTSTDISSAEGRYVKQNYSDITVIQV